MTKFHDFRLESSGPHGKDMRVYMDGTLLRGVRNATVFAAAGDATVITIEFIAQTLNDSRELRELLTKELEEE